MQSGGKTTITLLMMLSASVLAAAIYLLPAVGTEAVIPAAAQESLLLEHQQGEYVQQPEFRVEIIRPSSAPEKPAQRILIYHSHTWEAYTQSADIQYTETEKWRTKDNTANVVAVGTALTACLESLGYEVTHDTTAFEPPDLAGAYGRSLAMLEQRMAAGESYDLYIDLHRDAFDNPDAIQRTVSIAGEKVARFMVLIGKGTGLTGEAYAEKPDWEKNYEIAQKITDALNEQADKLARSICLRNGRFNQHIAHGCVLIECGSNHNTLEEVLNGVPYLAQAIHQTLQIAQ